MNITISKHAAQRAIERGITEDGIRAIVGGSVPTAVLPSNRDKEVIMVIGKHAGKLWTVPFNINVNNVVTVRRSRKKEEEHYYEKHR